MFKRKESLNFYSLLIKQAEVIRDAVAALCAYCQEPTKERGDFVKVKEKEADAVRRELVEDINRTFITPIDREDIYAISTAQERTIDSLNGLGTRFFLFSFVHVRFPAKKMILNIREMTRAIGDLLQCLRDKRPPSDPVAAVHGLKENCEMLVGVGLGELQDSEVVSFDQVKQLMVWEQLYDRIEQTVLLFSELTDTLEQAVLKYA